MSQSIPFTFATSPGGDVPASQLDTNFSTVNTSLTTEMTVASASTTDLGAQDSNVLGITGTAAINSFGSSATASQPLFFLRAEGAFTLVDSASLITLTGKNVTVASGDRLIMQYFGSGNWGMIYWSGLSAPALGTSGFVLTSTGLTSAPTYQSPGSGGRYKSGSFGCPAATGNFSQTGVGFQPSYLRLTPVLPSGVSTTSFTIGFGYVQASGGIAGSYFQSAGSSSNNSLDTGTGAGTAIQALSAVSSVTCQANLVSFDAGGFTLNFTSVNTNFTIIYECFG